ncbi:MAG TPA: alpha/beta hydrolase [Gemmatimonadaceae bacterium]
MHRSAVGLACAASLTLLASHPRHLRAQRVAAMVPRDTIAARLRDLDRIRTPEGIEQLEQLDVNGSKQWIQIRGLNRANPVLLVLHGGPGSPLMGMTWAYQKPWEDFFTVVNWDQRGVGKNFSPADSARLGATLSPEQLAEDAAVVAQHIRQELGKQKIAVMGFSYGTSIGTRLVQMHPDWFSVYVGVGQMSNEDNEKLIYDEVLHRAQAKKDDQVVHELDSIAPYPPTDRRPNYREMNMIRRYTALFDGNWYGKQDLSLYYALPAWGPDYTLEEAASVGPAMGWMGRHLVDDRSGERPHIPDRFEVPVVIFAGRNDLMTAYAGARAWFDHVTAPQKQFVTFERSAHFIMFEEPGRFLLNLVNVVLPLAGGSVPFERR